MSFNIHGLVGAQPIAETATRQTHKIGLRVRATDPTLGEAEFVYMVGVGGTVVGSWITYDEAGATALLAANAKGPVAVAMSANVANQYGWYCVFSMGVPARIAANCADNALIGRETADGDAGDGRAAGDQIYNAITRGSTAGAAALTNVQIVYPFVDDANGA